MNIVGIKFRCIQWVILGAVFSGCSQMPLKDVMQNNSKSNNQTADINSNGNLPSQKVNNQVNSKALKSYGLNAYSPDLAKSFSSNNSSTDSSNSSQYLQDKFYSPESGVNSVCRFPSDTVSNLSEYFKSGSGLLIPVYKIVKSNTNSVIRKNSSEGLNFSLEADWSETAKLHKNLTSYGKVKLLPISESKKYDVALQKHLSKSLAQHVDSIYKALGSDGGLLPMLQKMGKGRDSSDANKQISGPFNQNYYENVIKNTTGASYIISVSDGKIINGYFETLVTFFAGNDEGYMAPKGNDLNNVMVSKTIWSSYMASVDYLIGDISQQESEKATVGSFTRLVRVNVEGLEDQWKVLGPEYAITTKLIGEHGKARANINGILTVTPVEVFSNMTSLGYDASKLQCHVVDQQKFEILADVGKGAKDILDNLDKESNIFLGSNFRGMPNRNAQTGCIGWTCDRTIDTKRDERFATVRDLNQKLSTLKPTTLTKLNELMVNSFANAMNQAGMSGSINSTKLKKKK